MKSNLVPFRIATQNTRGAQNLNFEYAQNSEAIEIT